MIIPSNWQDLVTAAWDTIRGDFAKNLPDRVQGKTLSNQDYSMKIGVCNALNYGNPGLGVWADDGEGTLAVTELKLAHFNNVQAGDASFEQTRVTLPIAFDLLEASGRYSYIQPCAKYNLGKKIGSLQLNGQGNTTQKCEGGRLDYRLDVLFDPLRLDLKKADISGTQTGSVTPDGTPDNAILKWLTDVLGRLAERRTLEKALQTFFSYEKFSRDMVEELNQFIQGQAARGMAGPVAGGAI